MEDILHFFLQLLKVLRERINKIYDIASNIRNANAIEDLRYAVSAISLERLTRSKNLCIKDCA